jgi:peroxiredoxin
MARRITISITALSILVGFAGISAMGQKPDPKAIRLRSVGSGTQTTLKIGDTLPVLECSDLDGKVVDINDLYGEKATLVVFWATWCSACVLDLQHERRIAGAYSDRGLKVIGVNADEDIALAKTCIDLNYITWPMIHDPKEHQSNSGIVKSLGVTTWPTLLLFDGDRRLISATPDLRTTYSISDSLGNSYGVRGLDATLAKVLGQLNVQPHISIVE